VLGVEHLVFPLLFQGGVGAIGGDFAQGFFQAGLLFAVAMGLGLFDLGADGLALGGAAGQWAASSAASSGGS
jgi:hypothetical protein